MPAWQSYSYLFGPLSVGLVLVVLTLVLRWGFSRGGSLVQRRAQPGAPTDYGLLVSIAAPDSDDDGTVMRDLLADAGVRATLVHTSAGPRVMVFRTDEVRARAVLRQGRHRRAS